MAPQSNVWLRFKTAAERKIRYISTQFAETVNGLNEQSSKGDVTAVMNSFDRVKLEFKEIVDAIGESDHAEVDEEEIDAFSIRFHESATRHEAKLLNLQSRFDRQGGNGSENSYHTTHGDPEAARRAQIRLCKKQIVTIDDKLKSLEKFIDDYDFDNPSTSTVLQFYVNKATQVQTAADEAFTSILALFSDDDADVNTFEEKRVSFNDRLEQTLSDLLSRLDKANAAAKAEKSSSTSFKLKLEPLKIQEFHGNPTEWISFRDKFKALIHDNPDYSNVAKFTYLQGYIKDKHAPASLAASPTDSGYADVWKDVCEQYESDRNLLKCLFDTLLKTKQMSEESEGEMKRLKNEIQTCVDSVKRIKSLDDPFSAIVAHICLFRMDSRSKDLFETKNENKIPLWEELSAFLNQRSRTLGSCVTSKQQPKSSSANANKSNIQNKPTVKAHTAQQPQKGSQPKCNLCTEAHFTTRCSQLSSTPIADMLKKIESSNLCSNCLGKHNISDCNSKSSCQVCGEKHFTKFHDLLKNSNSSQTHHSSISNTVSTSSYVMLATGIVLLQNAKGQWVKKRALFDGGATKGFMKESCAVELGIKQNAVNIRGSAVSNQTIHIKSVATTRIKNSDDTFKRELEFNIVKQVTTELPSYHIPKSEFNIPDGYRLADPKFNVPTDCDVLIANDIYEDIRIQGKVKLDQGIVLKNTVFGWIVTGPLNSSFSSNTFASNFQQFQAYNLCDLNDSIQKFWKEEDYRKRDRFLTDEESKAEEHFQTTYRRDKDGTFEVSVPLNSKVDQLANNYNSALGQFIKLEKRLAKNPQLKQGCNDFMQDYIDSNDMSPVDITKDDPELTRFYFSFHPVMKEDSTTTKIRMVFNGSLKTASGLSYNDVQLTGPNVQIDTQSLLLKFRIPEIVVTADIAKMYRKFKIIEPQRPLQRIIYRAEPTDPLQVYQLNTVTYGTRSASFLATRCLHQLAIDNREKYPTASHILENNSYVDDVIFGFNSLDEHIQVTKDLLKITESANLDLRKFKSNKQEAIKFLPESKLEVGNDSNVHKALGIKWNTELDHIQFSYHTLPSVTITKRIALSEISKIYDPNGLLGPVTMMFKDFMRTLHQVEKNWDKVLPETYQQRWLHLVESSKSANDIKLPRHAVISNAVSMSLHGFSDASKLGFGACVYLVSEDAQGNRQSHLLASRSRLAGESQMPRLEVSGGVVLAHMITQIGDLLGIADRFCWMDSIIALCWINKEPANLKEFIRNRIDDIHNITKGSKCVWRHVATDKNPADILSRAMLASEFKTDPIKSALWWNGAPFLTLPCSEWPATLMEVDPTNPEYLCELKKYPMCHMFNDEDPRIDINFTCHQSNTTDNTFPVKNWIFDDKIFSSTMKVRTRVAIMCRFIHNCRAKALNKQRRSSSLSANRPISLIDYKEADLVIARVIQMEHFPREFDALQIGKLIPVNSKLIHHDAYWDKEDKVIRLGNRSKELEVCKQMKHPLPLIKCHYTKLILAELHSQNLHAGIRTTASLFNMRYWISDVHTTTRSVIHRCVKCFRCKPKLGQQYTGDLPKCRLEFDSAFHDSAVDYAGPFLIRSSTLRKAPQIKCWIAVFVCMGCGAVHIEVVTSLTKDAFIQTFHRFISRRGLCFSLMSDNAGCFVGTANEQKEFKKFLADHEKDFQEFFNIRHVEYKTIPPRSPHHGGIWEEKVKQLKRHLYPSIGQTVLTYEELNTICCRIEAVLNSRPLSYVNSDPNDPQPLTPGHFLIGRSLLSLPEADISDEKVSDLKRYRRVQQIFQHFHKRWLKEVLPKLQKRTKNFTLTSDYKVGQVVLMCDENAPPNYWPLAIITEIMPGKDDRVRVITFRTSTGSTFTRTVAKIAMLPIADNIDEHHFSGGE